MTDATAHVPAPGPTPAPADATGGGRFVPALAFAVAIVAGLSALRSYWQQDDWGLLARAAGLVGPDAHPVRFLSRDLYWRLLWPLFGADPVPWAATRALLHAAAAALVAIVAGRAGLGVAGRLAAGLLFAATPLAQTPLVWASGVQELLAVTLALAAIERWLAPPRPRDALLALACGVGALAAKESVAGLPLLLGLLARRGEGTIATRRLRAGVVAALAAAAVGAALLARAHFAAGAGEPYALDARAVPLHLVAYGLWLVSPGPLFATRFGVGAVAAALLLWGGWTALALRRRRGDDSVPAVALVGALLALAPALPLGGHLYPYLAYGAAAALAVAVGSLLPRAWTLDRRLAAVLAALVALAGGLRHEALWRAKGPDGLPRDPQVARAAVARSAVRVVRALAPTASAAGLGPLVLVQVPPTAEAAALEAGLPEAALAPDLMTTALGAPFGPRAALEGHPELRWVNRLVSVPSRAFVIAADGARLRRWGETGQARLYCALAEVARGQFPGAARHLLLAAWAGERRLAILYDPDELIEPAARVRERAPAFDAWLASGADGLVGPEEAQGLRTIFAELMAIVNEDAPSGRAP